MVFLKKKKTIVFFSGFYLPHLGGVERYTDNLGRHMIKNNYNVFVVTSNYGDLKDEDVLDGMKIIRLPIYNIFKNRYPIVKKNKKFKSLMQKLDNLDIDAVVVNTRFHLTSLIGSKYAKRRGIPVFLIEHGSQHLTVDNKILDFFGLIYEHLLTIKVKKYVDYAYGVSEGASKWLKHFNINSDGVWYNSINEFGNGVPLKKNGKILNITYAGRILKQKGIDRLIESFLRLDRDGIRLNIAGDGNLLSSLKNRYGNNKKISFLGKLDFDELIKLYAKTDIFVYAPIWPEGLPTAILEAGYMKCAVIASPYGGTKEIIINKKNGIMIENEDELVEALNLLINDKNLRAKYSLKLFNDVNKKFLWKSTCKKIMRDIDEKI